MKKKDLITLLAGLAVVVVLAAVFMRGDQLHRLIDTIERGTPVFLVLAFASQFMKYVFQAMSFTWCFKAAGARLSIIENFVLVFQTFFLDTIIPSFNISGTSRVVDAASKRGIEMGRATGAALLRQVSISAGFIIVMVGGFAVLFVLGKLETGWLVLGAGATLAVGLLVFVMVLAAARPQWVLKIVAPVEHLIDRVLARLKRHSIDASVKSLVDTYSSSTRGMEHHPADIFMELVLSVLAFLAELFCFYFVGVAFGVDDFEVAVCVYVVASLAAMVSPIPQGVGVVEGASLVAFTLFGIDQACGMAIIMVYRVFIFWLPFITGAVLMRDIKTTPEKKPTASDDGQSQ